MTTDLTPEVSACEHLERVEQLFGDYQKVVADLENYRAKAAGALADQESALANQSLTEQEAANQIAATQALRSVYDTRTAHKEAHQSQVGQVLATEVQAAGRELTRLIATEIGKRQSAVTERVMQALDVDRDSLAVHEALGLDQYVANLPDYSRSIRAISRLRTSTYADAGQPGDGAAAANAAKTLIENYKLFLKETSRLKIMLRTLRSQTETNLSQVENGRV
jgi:hypothetical protein